MQSRKELQDAPVSAATLLQRVAAAIFGAAT
jgi:hypothetical protein